MNRFDISSIWEGIKYGTLGMRIYSHLAGIFFAMVLNLKISENWMKIILENYYFLSLYLSSETIINPRTEGRQKFVLVPVLSELLGLKNTKN